MVDHSINRKVMLLIKINTPGIISYPKTYNLSIFISITTYKC
uniref:Uncharacterized protein n=1 Tax=Setaria italica TaxID=4555 RepID=K4A4I5_SETIT